MFKIECTVEKIPAEDLIPPPIGVENVLFLKECSPCSIGNYQLTSTSKALNKKDAQTLASASSYFGIPSFFDPLIYFADQLNENEIKTCKFVGLFDFNPNVVRASSIPHPFPLKHMVNLYSELLCNGKDIYSSRNILNFLHDDSYADKGVFEVIPNDKGGGITLDKYFLTFLQTQKNYSEDCNSDFSIPESRGLYEEYEKSLPTVIAKRPLELPKGTLLIYNDVEDREIKTNLDSLNVLCNSDIKSTIIQQFNLISFGNDLFTLDCSNYEQFNDNSQDLKYLVVESKVFLGDITNISSIAA